MRCGNAPTIRAQSLKWLICEALVGVAANDILAFKNGGGINGSGPMVKPSEIFAIFRFSAWTEGIPLHVWNGLFICVFEIFGKPALVANLYGLVCVSVAGI